MTALSPEEVLQNAIGPAQASLRDYGNQQIAFAQRRDAERQDLEREQRQEAAARALAVLHGQIIGGNEMALQGAQAKSAQALAQENARLILGREQEMLPLTEASELRKEGAKLEGQTKARLTEMTQSDKQLEAQKYRDDIPQKAGESLDDYLAHARPEWQAKKEEDIGKGVNGLKYFDDKKAAVDRKIEDLTAQHAANVQAQVKAAAASQFFDEKFVKDWHVMGKSVEDQVRGIMASKKVPLDEAVRQFAIQNPEYGPKAAQLYAGFVADNTAKLSDSEASRFVREQLNGLDREKLKWDTESSNYIFKHKHGSDVLDAYREEQPASALPVVQRHQALQDFLNVGPAQYTAPAGAGTVLRPGAPGAASTNAAAILNPTLTPSTVTSEDHPPSAALINPQNAARMLAAVGPGLGSPADVYDSANTPGPMNATDTLAGRILQEQRKATPFSTWRDAFGLSSNSPLADRWHDTLAGMLGVQPENIGSSIFQHSPGSVLKARHEAKDADLAKAIKKIGPDNLERLAASVLAGSAAPASAPVQMAAQPAMAPSSQPALPIDAALNPWILNRQFPQFSPTPAPFPPYPTQPQPAPEQILAAPY